MRALLHAQLRATRNRACEAGRLEDMPLADCASTVRDWLDDATVNQSYLARKVPNVGKLAASEKWLELFDDVVID